MHALPHGTVAGVSGPGNVRQTVARMEDAGGDAITVAPGDPYRVWIDLPPGAEGAFVTRLP